MQPEQSEEETGEEERTTDVMQMLMEAEEDEEETKIDAASVVDAATGKPMAPPISQVRSVNSMV